MSCGASTRGRSKKLCERGSNAVKKLTMTLVVLLLIGLVSGCNALMPTKPETCLATEPELAVYVTADGGICLGPDDTTAILMYIEDLERCTGIYQARARQ